MRLLVACVLLIVSHSLAFHRHHTTKLLGSLISHHPAFPSFALGAGAIEKDAVQAPEEHQRRVKVNKYAKFSKNRLDPLEEAIVRAEEAAVVEERAKIGDSPVRGTTVPQMVWETEKNVSKSSSKNKSYNSSSIGENNQTMKNIIPSGGVGSIVPSDPFTFGYVKIGVVIGPHGVKGELKMRFETDFADMRLQVRSKISAVSCSAV